MRGGGELKRGLLLPPLIPTFSPYAGGEGGEAVQPPLAFTPGQASTTAANVVKTAIAP